ESARGSAQRDDFHRLSLSARGAAAMIEKAREHKTLELRQGWVDVKLNSYAFARDAQGQVSDLYQTKDDFEAVTKAFQNAERDLRQTEKDLAQAQGDEAKAKKESDDRKAE